MLRSIRGFGGVLLAVALWALAPQAAGAAGDDSVSVHRGASVTAVAAVAAGGAGLVVSRGAPLRPLAYRPGRARIEARHLVAGERLWLIDAAGRRLTACALRRSGRVGREVIRCFTRDLPVALRAPD